MYLDADLHIATQRLILLYQDAEERQSVLIKDLSGGMLGQINHAYMQGPRWSPDGLKIAYFGDWCLYVHDRFESEAKRVIELPDYHASFCEWSPDSESLIFSAYPANRSASPNIYRYDFEGESITQITYSADVDRFPKWDRSGTRIACHRTYLDNPEHHTGIMIVHLNEQREQVLPRPADFSQRISRYCWSPDNEQLLVTEHRQGESRLVIYQIATGEIVWASEATDMMGGGFDPFTGHLAAVTNDALSMYELPSQIPYAQLRLSEAAPVRETLAGPTLFFDTDGETVYFLGRDSRFYRWRIQDGCEVIIEPEADTYERPYQRKDYSFRASDGFEVPVQRYIPANPNDRAILFVEGGPGGWMNPDDAIAVRLLDEGYEVLRPAYRGCGGYGDEHLKANERVCGLADVRDVVECGIDWRQRFNRPDAPLAVSGFSYGGYLTFLALMHEDAPWSCGITFWGATVIPSFFQAKGLPADPAERQKAFEARHRSVRRTASAIRC